MFVFRVVDLASQAAAFVRYTRGWSRDDIIAWLRQFGPGVAASTREDMYAFFAPCGLRTVFILTKTGELLLVGDHTVYRPLD